MERTQEKDTLSSHDKYSMALDAMIEIQDTISKGFLESDAKRSDLLTEVNVTLSRFTKDVRGR
jgi:hypothetical protein